MNLYRYIDMKSLGDDGAPTIILAVYPVVRETPASWYITVDGKEKHVLKGDGKRFAHERLEWAQYSFRRRKHSQLYHLRRQIAHTEKVQGLLDEDFPKSETVGEHFNFVERLADKVEPFEGFDFA